MSWFGKYRLDCCAGVGIQVIEKRHENITAMRKCRWKTRPSEPPRSIDKALQQIERLWHAAPGSPDEVRLEKLVTTVEAYEARKFSGWDDNQTQG
jgi:hypothetical protein